MTLVLRRDADHWVMRDMTLGRTHRLSLVPACTEAGQVVRAIQKQYPTEPVGVDSASIGPCTLSVYGPIVWFNKHGMVEGKKK